MRKINVHQLPSVFNYFRIARSVGLLPTLEDADNARDNNLLMLDNEPVNLTDRALSREKLIGKTMTYLDNSVLFIDGLSRTMRG